MVLPEGKILDFKFLDDRSLLVLWIGFGSSEACPRHQLTDHANPFIDSTPTLINIPFQSLSYSHYASGQVSEPTTFQEKSFGSLLTAAKFPEKSAFEPVHMEVVRSNSLRGEIPARVCLLGKDKVTYKVYAIPKEWESKKDVILEEDSVTDGLSLR
jgi:anaphase-promoting complex subunit 4